MNVYDYFIFIPAYTLVLEKYACTTRAVRNRNAGLVEERHELEEINILTSFPLFSNFLISLGKKY